MTASTSADSLRPDSEAALADFVRSAAADQTPLEIVGGGTRGALGRPVQAAKSLSLSGLSGINLYEPGALTLVVKAGTSLADIDAALAAENQWLPFEPMDHRALLGSSGEPTIGGVVASAVSGPRRIQAGACRDSVIGVRFVDGAGSVISNGGRVMKNVTGYDLAKFMCGTFGTLGVLTEISLKVLPRPETAATLVFHELDVAAAVATMADALGSPFEVTGAAHLPSHGNGPLTLLRLEGFEAQVDYRISRLQDRLKARGASEVVRGDAHTELWLATRDVSAFAGDARAVWHVSVKPSEAPAIVNAVREIDGSDVLLDWAGGRVWIAVPASDDAHATIVRGAVAEVGGSATLVRAAPAVRASVPVFHPEPAPLARLAKDLRAKFDPANILNPGRMVA